VSYLTAFWAFFKEIGPWLKGFIAGLAVSKGQQLVQENRDAKKHIADIKRIVAAPGSGGVQSALERLGKKGRVRG